MQGSITEILEYITNDQRIKEMRGATIPSSDIKF